MRIARVVALTPTLGKQWPRVGGSDFKFFVTTTEISVIESISAATIENKEGDSDCTFGLQARQLMRSRWNRARHRPYMRIARVVVLTPTLDKQWP